MLALPVLVAVMSQAPQTSLQPSPITRVVMLGTGTPVPDPVHQGPSVAIVVNGQPYIVDCGPGVIRQTSLATSKGIEGLGTAKLNHIFITHLHSDHTMGLPDFLLTPTVMDRRGPVEVYGPKGTKAMVGNIYKAWSADLDIRIHGGEGGQQADYRAHVHEIGEGEIYRDDNVRVKAFRVMHGKWKDAFGFRFETPDRVIVVSGDTTYCPNLIENARGCDVLIHEVYSNAGLKLREKAWQDYHSTYHTSGPDLGRLASEVQPKLLVLYHMLPFRQPRTEVVDEVRTTFSGEVVDAKDLDVF